VPFAESQAAKLPNCRVAELPSFRVPLVLRLFWRACRAWWDDSVPRLGASLAYYTLFALAPVLLVAIAIAGAVFGADAVHGRILSEIDQLIGRDGAATVQALLAGAAKRSSNRWASIVGGAAFLIAASGAFLELQAALNTIWRVKAKPGVHVVAFVLNRLRSFGIVVAIGFLLLVSLAVSAALAAFWGWLDQYLPGSELFWNGVNAVISFGVITTLFTLIYRILPDVHLRWRDAAVGGVGTAALFTLGKQLIGLYLGRSAFASSYGAAASVLVILVWVYYSAQIVLLGAEFTRVYAAPSIYSALWRRLRWLPA
jgi:membrane protein